MPRGKAREKPNIPVMIRPVGSYCPQACVDCYTNSGPDAKYAPMLRAMLAVTMASQIADSELPIFIFQGGAPTAAGLAWYHMMSGLQSELGIWPRDDGHLPNSIQIGAPPSWEEIHGPWLDYFADSGFAVGISYNGPRSVLRPFRQRDPDLIAACFERGKGLGIPMSLLAVVDSQMARSPHYREDIRHLFQVSPVVYLLPARRTAWAPKPSDYLRYVIYADKYAREVGTTLVNTSNARLMWQNEWTDCQIAPWCHAGVVVNNDGKMYSCEWYMDDDHYLGNIVNVDIAVAQMRAMRPRRASADIRGECLGCPAEGGCYGGCPVDVGPTAANRYCSSLKAISLLAKRDVGKDPR